MERPRFGRAELEEQPAGTGIASSAPASSSGRPNRLGLIVVGVFAFVAAVSAAYVVGTRPGSSGEQTATSPAGESSSDHGTDSGDVADSAGGSVDATVPPSTAAPETTATTTVPASRADTSENTEPQAPVELLQPVSAVASNERSAVSRLRCGGSNSFEAELLIDGDLDTGWGASQGDGRGESVTIDFGRQVIIERVGLSPGYLRVAPRASNDCRSTPAFEFNRFVDRVEYRFDDNSVVVQEFVREPSIQEMAIEPVSTRRVSIFIVSTSRQVEDDDTVLSEAVFYGRNS